MPEVQPDGTLFGLIVYRYGIAAWTSNSSFITR